MKHITPSEEIFNEMINIASLIWLQYDNEFGYVTEKLERINSITNYEDNVMAVYRMFDHVNQSKFIALASNDVLEYIKNNQ
jgi:hypothetical protein